MKTFTIRIAFAITILFFGFSNSSKACYANFVHSNACAGDTAWFIGLDNYASQAWDFGDSTSSNPNWSFSDTAYHVYTAPGTYYVSHFVNIGAEYAFETQVITIGVNCFEAGFDVSCNGSLYMTFQNQSVGNPLSYSWDFGDPLSGINNSSALQNPGHQYAATGNYPVTLIVSDGIQTDTSIQIISVDSSCMSVSISYLGNPCAGDSTHFYIYTTGVTSMSWDFGDPASGADNYSTSFNPAHLFATPGLYIGTLIYSNGISSDTFPIITNVVDCNVWAGDANRDGKVNGEDILAICLYNGDAGTPRPNASLNFTSQPSPDWSSGTLSPIMYLQDIVNKKFADCNGDGTISVADVQAVTQNFGMIHLPHNTLASMQLVPADAPRLSLTLPSTVFSSDPVTAELSLGDNFHQLNGVYGFSIIVEYDPSVADGNSIAVDFANSWLDSSAQNHLLNWFRNDVANGKLYLVSVRTNQVSVGGYGHLAFVHFNTSAGFSGNLNLTINNDAKVMTNNYSLMGYSNVENFARVNIDDATSTVSVGIRENSLPANIHLYPSPASDFIYVDFSLQNDVGFVTIYDALGKEVSVTAATSHTAIPVQDLQPGIYLLRLVTGEKIYALKIPIVH